MTGAPDPAQIGPSAQVSCTIDQPLQVVWAMFVPVSLPDVFPKAKGPIPRVAAVEDQSGSWDEVGQTRKVVLGDGNTAKETITFSNPSGGTPATDTTAEFAYTVSEVTGPLSMLVTEARGRWVFTRRGGQTDVVWTYGFIPKSLPMRPILSVLATTFWKAYMRAGLDNIKALTEAH